MSRRIKKAKIVIKEDVVKFSNSYFHVYHEISKQLVESETDQIGNFFSGSLFALKKLIESKSPNQLKRELALIKTKRLVNEVVLLQYKIDITRISLLTFLEAANVIIDCLEDETE